MNKKTPLNNSSARHQRESTNGKTFVNRQELSFIKKLAVLMFLIFSMNLYSASLPNKLLNIPIHLISGEQVSLAQYKGKKPVYLKFWATWCQPCMKEMPHFEHIENIYNKSIKVIGINLGINDDLTTVKNIIKKFGLTMPIAIDESGDLAQAFKMIGTPYHLLFDKNMNLIHQGHEANESLDNKLSLVSQTKSVDLLNASLLSENETNIKLTLNDGKAHALFFTATWCDWYLKDSRPEISKNCSLAQSNINKFLKKYPNIIWHGIISRLWTGDKDLLEYKNKFNVDHDLEIDKNNSLFHRYLVKELPTLVLIVNGKIVLKETDFSDNKKIEKILSEY